MEIFILNDKFEVLAEIDSYTSLIWCRRAHSIGALDLEIEASTENVERFQIGYFIYRKDTNDICRIDSIEVTTDPENGDQLIIGAVDLKSLAEQVTVLGEYKTEITNDGESTIVVKNEVNVEEWIREAMKVFTSNDSTVLPKSVYPQFQIDNFSLYNLKGYETKQVLLEEKDAKLSEHINYLCKMAGMSWEITYDYDTGLLNLNVVKGLDKTVNQDDNIRVLFSKTFDNLQSTKIAQSIGKMANVAVVHHNNASIVGDSGVVFAYLTREEPYGIYRFDISVDGTSVEIPHIQTDADFVEVPEGTGAYKKNDDGTFTKGKGNYDYHPQYTVDEIKSYREILKGLGLAKLRESRVSQNFESEINFNQFVYREDYDVGDVVTVQNDYGIQLDAKIIEVVETWDETGYSIEPAFEFIGAGGNFGGFGGFGNFENTENDWDLTDCLITEDNEPMMTETENFYLMYEAGITTLATEYGIALTSENDALITTISSGLEPTAQVASMATYGAEAVATTTYDVSATSAVDIETVKISELPEADSIGDACCLPIVQDGETKKIYFDKIKNNIEFDDSYLRTLIDGKSDISHTHESLKRTQLAKGTDLNNITTPGEYYAIDNEGYTNAPTTNFTMQVVTVMSSNTIQILYCYNNRVFTRTRMPSATGEKYWTGWKEYEYVGHAATKGDITDLQTQIDAKLANKSDISHTHTSLKYSVIPAGANLNNYTTEGNYVSTANVDFVNTPTEGMWNFRLEVFQLMNQSIMAQRITHYGGNVWIRTQASDAVGNKYWLSWKKLAFDFNSVIPAGADLNNYTTEGNYVSAANKTFTNAPTSDFTNFRLEVYQLMDEGYMAQRITQYSSGNVWIRTQVWGSSGKYWTSWKRLLTNGSNTMAAGGSIDFNTNKATIQIPIFSADATNQPTAQGAFWIQEVKESE